MKLDTLIYDIIDIVILAANKVQCSSSTYSTAVKLFLVGVNFGTQERIGKGF